MDGIHYINIKQRTKATSTHSIGYMWSLLFIDYGLLLLSWWWWLVVISVVIFPLHCPSASLYPLHSLLLIFGAVLIFEADVDGGGVLILLVLRDEVVHIGLSLGELHLVHPL